MKAYLLASVSSQALAAAAGGGGSLEPDAAHRYWRVRVARWGANGYVGLSGIQMYEAGTNVAPQGTFTGDTTPQAGSYAEVLNYTSSSLLQFGGAMSQGSVVNLLFDFGANNAKKIDTVGIYPNKDYAGRTPTAFWLEWSDDNIAWTTHAFVRDTAAPTVGTETKYAVPAKKTNANYWAIFGWSPTGSFGELEFLRDNVDLTTGQTAFASASYQGDTSLVPNGIDDNTNTEWAGGGDNNAVLYGVQFATAVQPDRVTITSRNDNRYWTQTPWKNIFYGYGDDQKTFRVKKEITGNPASNPYSGPVQKVGYDVPYWVNAERYWRVRLRNREQSTNGYVGMLGIEMAAAKGGPNLIDTTKAATNGAGSGTYAFEPATNAFAQNGQNGVVGSSDDGYWYSWGFEQPVEIAEVRLKPRAGYFQQWPSGLIEVQSSPDRVAWTTAFTYTMIEQDTLYQGEFFAVYKGKSRPAAPDKHAAYKRWRIRAFDTYDTSYNTLAKAATYSDQAATQVNDPTNATFRYSSRQEGSPGREWQSNSFVVNNWVAAQTGLLGYSVFEIDYPSAVVVNAVKITSRDAYGQAIKGFAVEYSPDGENWYESWRVSDIPAWAADESRTFAYTDPALASYNGLGFTPKGAWGLRKMIDNYTGPLVRVRDTTTDAESDLAAGADGKLVAFTGSPAVVKVYDQSGNGADIGQPTTTKQPLLVANATKKGGPAIRFDGADDFLCDPVAAVDRPYMTAKIVSHQVYSRSAGSESYGSGVHIANEGGANTSPYKRWGWNWGNGSLDFRMNGVGLFSLPMGSAGFPFMNENGGVGALQTWGNMVRVTGLPGVNISVNNADTTYPTATGLYIGGNGAGEENWACDFVELVMGSPDARTDTTTADAFCMFCDKIACALLLDDYEVTAIVVKTPGTAGNVGVSAGEIELLSADNTDLTTSPLASYGTHRYNGTESWERLFDNDPNTLWSADGDNFWPVLAYRAAATMERTLPTHGTHQVRNDSHVYAGSIKTMYLMVLTKDGWIKSDDIVLPDGPVAGRINSFSINFPGVEMPEPEEPEEPTITWTSLYTTTPVATQSESGNTLRGRIATSALSSLPRYVRFKLQAGADGATISKATAARGVNADYSLSGSPLALTFGGADSYTAAANEVFYTDPFDTNAVAAGSRLQLSLLLAAGGLQVGADNQRALTGRATGDLTAQTASTGFADIANQRTILLAVEGTASIS